MGLLDSELDRLRKRNAELEATAPKTRAAEDVLGERARQIAEEGWSLENDDQHNCGELAAAAASYALVSYSLVQPAFRAEVLDFIRVLWPWEPAWWKPKNSRHDLVRAGALILAEIERIDREEARLARAALESLAESQGRSE